MPKPTSTALNLDDNLGDASANPVHGDAPGPGQGTQRPRATSTGVTRPSHLAALSTADHAERAASNRKPKITVNVHKDHFEPKDSEVPPSGKVTLQYKGDPPRTDVLVRTSWGNPPAPFPVFTQGPGPYPADGTTYDIDPKINGDITIEVVIPNSAASLLRDDDDDDGDDDRGNGDDDRRREGGTGTINVGN